MVQKHAALGARPGRDATVAILGVVPRRYVVFGAGAIGGVIAGFLHRAECDVVGIARGAHLAAIRQHGLSLRTPDGAFTVHLPVAATPREIRWRDDDVVLLAMKSQDTQAALHELATAAPPSIVVVCAQNGVANERAALRCFETTLGMCVICPATHLAARGGGGGVVTVSGDPRCGSLPLRERCHRRGGRRGAARRHLRLACGA